MNKKNHSVFRNRAGKRLGGGRSGLRNPYVVGAIGAPLVASTVVAGAVAPTGGRPGPSQLRQVIERVDPSPHGAISAVPVTAIDNNTVSISVPKRPHLGNAEVGLSTDFASGTHPDQVIAVVDWNQGKATVTAKPVTQEPLSQRLRADVSPYGDVRLTLAGSGEGTLKGSLSLSAGSDGKLRVSGQQNFSIVYVQQNVAGAKKVVAAKGPAPSRPSPGPADISAVLTSYTASSVTLDSCPTLKLGDQGPCVEQLQTELNTDDDAGLAVNGTFGQSTQNVVKAFQQDHGVVPFDGIVGPGTKAALDNPTAGISPGELAQSPVGPTSSVGTTCAAAGTAGEGYCQTEQIGGQIVDTLGTGANALGQGCVKGIVGAATGASIFGKWPRQANLRLFVRWERSEAGSARWELTYRGFRPTGVLAELDTIGRANSRPDQKEKESCV